MLNRSRSIVDAANLDANVPIAESLLQEYKVR